jgi:hypothetical protein
MTTAAKAARLVFALLALSPSLGSAAPAPDAEAAPAVVVSPPPPKSLNIGVGLRVGGSVDSSTATSSTAGLTTLDVRPYVSGQVHPLLKFEGNLDLNNGDNSRIRVLDAVGKIEPTDLFNVWFGRFLPPSDRANLSGPYYQNAWIFPTGVNGYPSIYAGRADGGAIWGQLEKGKYKYQGGIFTLGSNTPTSQLLYAGRLVANFLDPEPGYYNSSTYYGAKDVLALGGAVQYQQNGSSVQIGTDATGAPVFAQKDFLGFNFDLLFEKKLSGADVVTLEGAYYNFNKGAQGWSWYALGSYLFGTKLVFGRVQPMVRWQQQTPTAGGDSTKVLDGGLNYIVDGHNTRFAFVIENRNPPTAPSTTSYQLGFQIQE